MHRWCLAFPLLLLILGCPKPGTPPRDPSKTPTPGTAAADGIWKPSWARTFGATHLDSIDAMTLDSVGNIYCTGRFFGAADFDPGEGEAALESPHPDFPIAYVAKYDPSGAYQWAYPIGGKSHALGSAVVIDTAGNCWVAGGFRAQADFDPDPAAEDLRSALEFDGFLLQFSPEGKRLRAITASGSNIDDLMALHPNPDGSLTCTGRSSRKLSFFDGTDRVTHETAAYASSFITTIPTKGLPTQIASWANTSDRGRNLLTPGPEEGWLIAGIFGAATDFDPGPNERLAAPTNRTQAFLLALDSDFAFQRVDTWGAGIYHEILQLQSAADGGVVLTGQYIETTDLNPFAEEIPLTAPEGLQGYLLRLDSPTTFGWVKGLGTTPAGLALGPEGAIYVSGDFGGTADLDPGPGLAQYTSPDEGHDAFLAAFNATGELESLQTLGGPHFQMLSALALTPEGALLVAGRFQHAFTLATQTETLNWQARGEGDSDSFLASFPLPGPPVTPTPPTP